MKIRLASLDEKPSKPESEIGEMWSGVMRKLNPRWLWYAIDHHRGKVLA